MYSFLARATWILTCSLIIAPAAFSQKASPSPPPPIIYTGKLIGYSRVPSLQSSNRQGCPTLDEARNGTDGNSRASAAAHKFLFSDGGVPAGAILVGTGDNFSPQLESRVFNPTPPTVSSGAPGGRLAPANKELYSWYEEGKRWVYYQNTDDIPALKSRLHNGTNTVPSDNVACFLAAAGYVAIVPGKHDFYFGPERLRQLARFMAGVNQPGYSPVQMLGANLVIKTTPIKSLDLAPEKKKWGWPEKLSLLNIADGGQVYPWLPYVRVKLVEFSPHSKVAIRLKEIAGQDGNTEAAFRSALNQLNPADVTPDDQSKLQETLARMGELAPMAAYVCPASNGRDNIMVSNNCRLNPEERLFRLVDNGIVEDFGFELNPATPALAPGKNYGLVLEPNDSTRQCDAKDKVVSCIRFSTRLPFFHFQDSDENRNYDPSPFVFLAKKNAVIFGIVDQALSEQVGVLNFSWNNDHPEYNTVVSVEDPVEALQTQLDFFNLTHKDFNGIKILLAQMSPERARALGAHFPELQIVVTAADAERSTSETIFSTTWAQGPHAKAFVAIPSPYFDPEQRDRYQGIIHLGKINVALEDPKNVKQENFTRNISSNVAWRLSSDRITPRPVDLAANLSAPVVSQPTFGSLVDKRLSLCKDGIGPGDYYNKIQLLTLCLMRERTGADVALIQKRDFFEDLPDAQFNDPREFQAAFDRIVWKGDLLTLLYVPGAALKSALDQSKKFDVEDGSALSLADEKLRGLQFIGVHLDPISKKYVINEMPLDDKKIYAVATTDYIGAGDTGYPDLANAALNPRSRADRFPGELVPLSGLVCRGLFDDVGASLPYCLPDLKTAAYLDRTSLAVDNTGAPVTLGSKLTKFFKPTDYKWSTPLSLDDRVQRRSIWALSLKNFSLTFNSLNNNLSDDDLTKKFGGVSTSGITASKTHTVAVSVDMRLSRSSHNYEFFLASSLDYKAQSTGDTNPKIVQLSNRVTGEAGIVRSLLGGRAQSRLGATFTFHTEMPLARPFTMFTLSGTDRLKITQPRGLLLLPRVGLRWQSDTNYFEGGAQVGRELRALSGYRFDTTNDVCLPNSAETFGACVSRLSKTTPPSITKDTVGSAILERRRRAGLYWKAGLSIPIMEKIKYEFTDEGNFFFNFHEDNATDTRGWDSEKHSLKFSIFPSFSIGPSLQLIFFRNKINRDLLFQRQFGFETTFAFDLFNSREKGIQVQHKP